MKLHLWKEKKTFEYLYLISQFIEHHALFLNYSRIFLKFYSYGISVFSLFKVDGPKYNNCQKTNMQIEKKRLFQTLTALILREKNSAVCLFKSFLK